MGLVSIEYGFVVCFVLFSLLRMLQEDKTKFNRTWDNPCGDYYRILNSKVFKFFLLCRVVTFIIFTVCIILVIPMAVSFFSVVYLCYFIGYLGRTKKKLNNAEVKLNRLTVVVVRPFDCEACTEEELLRRCKEKHLSQDNTNLAVEFFVLKTKQSKIADELCISEKSVQVRKKD